MELVRPDFEKLAGQARAFHDADQRLVGPIPTVAITPVDMHNVSAADIFRPTMWQRFGGDDFRVCDYLGVVYR